MKNTRCEEIVVQLIVRSYDDVGRPVREQVGQPVKVFRALARDFWAEVDKQVSELDASNAEQDVKPRDVKKKGK